MSVMRAITALVFMACLVSFACHRGPILPLASADTASREDPTQDHVKMASFYVRKAMRFRELAGEQANRALVYQRVFGADSDWVSSARILSQFYENAANEQEREANLQLELAGQRSETRQETSGTP